MSKSTRKDIDKLLREARKVGFEVGTQGTYWRVTNPLTGSHVLVSRQPGTGHGLDNERAKLRRIGFEPGVPDLRVRTSPLPRAVPADVGQAEPALEVAAEAPPPVAEKLARNGTPRPQEEPPMPEISETVRITGKGRNLREDLPTNSWLLWTAIHEGETTEPHELDGVAGVLWRGGLNTKVSDMWPALPRQDTDTRNAINRYLRSSGNMICLKRESRPPLWWLSSTWIEAKPDMPATVTPTRTERRLTRNQAGEDRQPAPVSTRRLAVVTSPEKESNGVDPLAAITEVVERLKTLERRNLELENVNEVLERENGELKAQVSRIKQAFRDLSA